MEPLTDDEIAKLVDGYYAKHSQYKRDDAKFYLTKRGIYGFERCKVEEAIKKKHGQPGLWKG